MQNCAALGSRSANGHFDLARRKDIFSKINPDNRTHVGRIFIWTECKWNADVQGPPHDRLPRKLTKRKAPATR
jgi:hypothetical protein